MALTKVTEGLIKTNPHRKNVVINGNFDIWQRGTSQTVNGYGSDDRWLNAHSGSTKTHSRQAFTIGQTDVPGEPKFYSRTVVTSVAGASNFVGKRHKVEDVRTFAGKTATLSFYAKADAAKNIAVEFSQEFGTGGSPSALNVFHSATLSLTTTWAKYTVTVAVPSIAGKVLGTNEDNYLQLFFWFEAGSTYDSRTNSLGHQSGTFDIAQVQLEEGDTATDFEHRLPGEELARCQRYFIRFDGDGSPSGRFYTPTSSSTNNVVAGSRSLPVTMRTVPTFTSSTQLRNAVNGITNVDRDVNAVSGSETDVSVSVIRTFTAGSETGTIHTITGQYVECDAEL